MNCRTRVLARLIEVSIVSFLVASAHAQPMYYLDEPEDSSEPIQLECGADVNITGRSVLATSTKPGKEEEALLFAEGATRQGREELQRQLDLFWTAIYGRYAVTHQVFGEVDGQSEIAWSHARTRAERDFRKEVAKLNGLLPKEKQDILKESALCLDHFENSSGIAERYVCPEECPPTFHYRAWIDSREMKLDRSNPADIIGRQVFCGDRGYLNCDPLGDTID